ncbi:MAG: hypothetical protein JWM47_2497 [Acidimicrobiales bacterium]|nr:hypothetical protein [Acidimicrobiales bacterium]
MATFADLPATVDADELDRFVRRWCADQPFMEALWLSSPSLATKLASTTSPAGAAEALSLYKYVSRAATRPTPFGLLAGVAEGRLSGERSRWHLEVPGVRRASIGFGWIDDLAREILHSAGADLPGRLYANQLNRTFGDRVHAPQTPGQRRPSSRSLGRTPAVDAILDRSAPGASHRDLASVLHELAPRSTAADRRAFLEGLLRAGFLLSDVIPHASCTDPLEHLLASLGPAEQTRPRIVRLQSALASYERSEPGAEGTARLQDARDALAAVQPAAVAPRLKVDLAWHGEISLPTGIGRDVADAVEVLRALAPTTSSDLALQAYARSMIDRYGRGAAVPVITLIDPVRGMGLPSSLRRHDHGRALSPATSAIDEDRDRLLGQLLQEALASGRPAEITRPVLQRLAGRFDDTGVAPVDICASLEAASTSALDRGAYRLWVTNVGRSGEPGSFAGRFLTTLDRRGEEPRLRATVRAGVLGPQGQVVFDPGIRGTENLMDVPLVLDRAVYLGCPPHPPEAQHLSLDRLWVSAADDGMTLYAEDHRGVLAEVRLRIPHMVNTTALGPDEVRFLEMVGRSRERGPHPWTWGSLSPLVHFPRVVVGRVVLAPETWRLPPELASQVGGAGTSTETEDWRASFDRWRSVHGVPDRVRLQLGDEALAIDLETPIGRRLLRSEARARPGLIVTECPSLGPDDSGGPGGHAAEIVVTVHPTAPEDRGRPPGRKAAHAPSHQPGGRWVSAEVACPLSLQADVVSEGLPVLLEDIAELADRWFFVRFTDETEHLRVRLHATSTAAIEPLTAALTRWHAVQHRTGLVGDLVFRPYRVEAERYGGHTCHLLAEHVFHADSELTLELLAHRTSGRAGCELIPTVAFSAVDAVRSFCSGSGTSPGQFAVGLPRELTRFDGPERRSTIEAIRTRLGRNGPPFVDLIGGLCGAWERRAAALSAYGASLSPDGAHGRLSDLLHMQHNRLVGPDRSSEEVALELVRQALISWDRAPVVGP